MSNDLGSNDLGSNDLGSNDPGPSEQYGKGVAFRDLHQSDDLFVMPNAWNAGSARLLSSLGFVALATTSGGLAQSLGRADGSNQVTRAETLENARSIVESTRLPVSADLESCFAETAAGVGETIRLAAEAGLVGGSIEDATGDPADPVRSLDDAVERVAAAVSAARALSFPFTLTARAENFLYGRRDIGDTIARLQAYAAAGADVLYAPGLPDLESVRAVCSALDGPVNVLASAGQTLAELRACGVRRVSLGSALSRAALGSARRAALEVLERGTFTFAADGIPNAELNALMSGPR
jgi:2-methylisocitrate lyase-like PEP mutase family enzyme